MDFLHRCWPTPIADLEAALRGSMDALSDRLHWTERQHDSGSWNVQVTLDGFDGWFGNDGHLLSTDREECRFAAFCSLMALYDEERPR